MTDTWEDMKRAKEEEYFEKQNKEALSKRKTSSETKQQSRERLCPVDGTELQQIDLYNIQIDRCPKCNGIWLDSGELEQITLNKAVDDAKSD